MENRLIGSSGLLVSQIGLGCHNFGRLTDNQRSAELVHQALDLGVTLFDTALVYGDSIGGAERILGNALGENRQDAVIVTKGGVDTQCNTGLKGDGSRSNLISNVERSLRHLSTDYIDIYMLHLPDKTTPIEETLRALDDIVTSGKVRYLACSNMTAWRVVEALWVSKSEGWNRFILSQNEYSLVNRRPERELIPVLERYGLGLMPHTPLAHGLLTGKFAKGAKPEDSRLGQNIWRSGDRYLTPQRLAIADELTEFALSQGHTMLDVAMGWLLSNSVVCSVIAGVTKPGQLQANVAAARCKLTDDELTEINKISQG